MSEGPHPYFELSLFWVGLLLGVFLIGFHLFLLLKADFAKAWLARLPRHYQSGVVVMGLGMLWFWLLVAPEVRGPFSFLGALSMDLGEFRGAKGYLQLGVPLAFLGMVTQVREFLFVRGLGLLMLMAAAPILSAAFLEEPTTRLLLPIYAYGLIIAGLYFVGMPFLFRDLAIWVLAKPVRWTGLVWGGLGYGILIFACALLFWRGF